MSPERDRAASRPKVFVMVDMEGISGVYRNAQVETGEAAWAEACAYMVEDVNACAEGLFEGGARTVVVRDVHAKACNLRWCELDPRIELIQGDGPHGGRMPGVRGFDGVVLLGYHAMAGTPHAILEHTSSSTAWQRFWINGTESGEIAIDAACAGDEGVPVIMVSGDDKTCAEAQRFLPGVVTARVKTGLDREYARLLSREAAHALIKSKARDACRQAGDLKPFKVKRPVRLRVELVERQALPNAEGKPFMKIVDGRTYEVAGQTFQEARARVLY